jgi:AraC-like DNA-binding protein
MATSSRVLASGPGWRVSDVVCDSGPRDRPFEERHDAVSIALVVGGTFQYRTAEGKAVLAPGSTLLGNRGSCYECGHQHGRGDRCIAFRFEPELFERIVADTPGVTRVSFAVPSLPPLPALAPLMAQAEFARDESDTGALEEVALRVAGAVLEALDDRHPSAPRARTEEERRVSTALRRIDATADEPLPLSRLADEACMSPYHFLRVFRRVAGVTPHQFVLSRRLHRAALRLRRSREPIAQIAFDAGFEDLSTFNRRFRRVMGTTPGGFRAMGA